MKKAHFFLSLILVSVLMVSQAAAVLAAPEREDSVYITGAVQKIKLEKDTNTAATIVVVTVKDEDGDAQTFRLSVEIAIDPELGLVTLDEDGNPVINKAALGQQIQVDSMSVILEEKHPVGSALATFFDVDYSTIMDYHESGIGFGVLTQALWLTKKIAGEDATADDIAVIFTEVMKVKNGETTYEEFYTEFLADDGSIDMATIPTSWAEFRKALLNGEKKVNLGAIMSQKDEKTGNSPATNEHSNKDKNKDKSNNGKGGGSESGTENGKKP